MKLKHYLLASDFDQTLSFNDSGLVLSHLIGASDFTEKVSGLSRMHFIQQGGELAYLLLHDCNGSQSFPLRISCCFPSSFAACWRPKSANRQSERGELPSSGIGYLPV